MDQVLVTETSLEEIADAIREKNGLERTYKPAQMAPAIRALDGNGTDAEYVSYDNTASGLEADNVQSAIDELETEIANRRLWYKDVAVSAITGSIIDLQDSRITADYVLEGGVITWGDSSKITSLTNWSTDTSGHFIVTGTASAATTATFALVKADQRIENNS